MPIYVHVVDMPALNAACRNASAKVVRVHKFEHGFRVDTNAILSPLEMTTIKTLLDAAAKMLVREAPELDR